MPKYIMSDGREFTNYQTSYTLDKNIQEKYKISNSHEYRLFLQKNTDKIMRDLNQRQDQCIVCPSCGEALKYSPNK